MIKVWKTKASDSDSFLLTNKPLETPGWYPDHVTVENEEGYFMGLEDMIALLCFSEELLREHEANGDSSFDYKKAVYGFLRRSGEI